MSIHGIMDTKRPGVIGVTPAMVATCVEVPTMADSTCSAQGCERAPHGRGLCGLHYQRWRDYGDAERLRPTDEERFWSKVDRSGGPDACWPWTGHLTQWGYGGFYWAGRVRGAHRFALSLRLGRPLSRNEMARHQCHNPPCVNPGHLLPGTHAENVRDMVDAGRATQTGSRGEDNGKSLLTEAQVREIRASTESSRVMAERLGVSRSAIKAVRTGQNWGHVA